MLINEQTVKLFEAMTDVATILESSTNKDTLRDKIIDYMLRNRISSLNKYTWEELKQISKEGRGQELFDIGETKLMLIDNVIYNAMLVAFNYNTIDLDPEKADYRDYNGGTGLAHMMFQLKEIYIDYFQFEGLDRNERNIDDTVINSTLNYYIMKKLEEDLVENITGVYRTYNQESERNSYKIFLPTEYEIFGKNEYGRDESEVYSRLPVYTTYPTFVKKFTVDNKSGAYWTATANKGNTISYVFCNRNGYPNYARALSVGVGASFCWCI